MRIREGEHPWGDVGQLVLLGLVRLFGPLLLVAQRHEPVGFAPSLWLIEELTFLVGVGEPGPFPIGPL